MKFTPLDLVEWRRTKIHKTSEEGPEADHVWAYEFDLPRPLADWDVFAVWERPRVVSMEQHLKQGDVLFDVGTEQGWCNLIYASIVGPENMVLIEPTECFWPNIQATWFANYGRNQNPILCYDGLLSDETTDPRTNFTTWPTPSDGPLIDRNKYQYIHDNPDGIPELRLDDLVERTGVVPDAITIDVEGAELLVLHGATQTLATHSPLVWVSVHPEMMERDYHVTADELHTFMAHLGYNTGQHLSTDHEEHWFYA